MKEGPEQRKFICPKCKKEFTAEVGQTVEILMCEDCGDYAVRVEEVKG